jgi:transposase-like protein
MLDILMRGVSTRQYREVIPEMADTVGISKSSVSRQTIEASEFEVEALLDRRFDEVNLLIIYIDGMEFGDHVMIGAVGVDADGRKHVLAIREGATENATVAKELLEDLVARGVKPGQKRLFVIDAPRRSARRSAQCSARSIRCNGVAPTSCATSWTTWSKSRRAK